MESLLIRVANINDVEDLVDFNCALAAETEDKMLDRAKVARGVTRAFEQGNEATYFVAELESRVIGSLMMTREWSDWRDGWLMWLQSVYVIPEQRGLGVFRRMLDHATETVSLDPDVVGLRLYVENDNLRAQSVYLRNGFTDPRYKVLERPIRR